MPVDYLQSKCKPYSASQPTPSRHHRVAPVHLPPRYALELPDEEDDDEADGEGCNVEEEEHTGVEAAEGELVEAIGHHLQHSQRKRHKRHSDQYVDKGTGAACAAITESVCEGTSEAVAVRKVRKVLTTQAMATLNHAGVIMLD